MVIWPIIAKIIKTIPGIIKEGENITDFVIEKIKKPAEVYVEKKTNETKAYIADEVTKLRTKIIRCIVLAWVIQTGLIIAVLFLFFK